MKRLRILVVMVVVVLFTGCAGMQDSKDTNSYVNKSFHNGSVTTYFYHSEDCHYCGIVEPYVEYLSSEMDSDTDSVKFDFCNVKNPGKCSEESMELKEEIGLKGIPAVVVVGNNTSKFMGWKEICNLGTYYQELGKKLPVITCHGKNYTVQECVDCHRKNGMEPPSKFDCSCPKIN